MCPMRLHPEESGDSQPQESEQGSPQTIHSHPELGQHPRPYMQWQLVLPLPRLWSPLSPLHPGDGDTRADTNSPALGSSQC